MLTPKAKAIQLIDKFFEYVNPWNDDGKASYGMAWKNAKKAALIAVDEIIESRKDDARFDDTLASFSEYHTPHPMYLKYWQEIIQEIEKFFEERECVNEAQNLERI